MLDAFFIFRDKLVSGKYTFHFIIKIQEKYDLHSKNTLIKYHWDEFSPLNIYYFHFFPEYLVIYWISVCSIITNVTGCVFIYLFVIFLTFYLDYKTCITKSVFFLVLYLLLQCLMMLLWAQGTGLLLKIVNWVCEYLQNVGCIVPTFLLTAFWNNMYCLTHLKAYINFLCRSLNV